MMPAMRAEIYVRNDEKPHTTQQVYILKSKKHAVGTGEWPEIRLARIVLELNAATSKVAIALNAPVATAGPPHVLSHAVAVEKPELPKGCVRDLKPDLHEYRRITFSGFEPDWRVRTEIVSPKAPERAESDQKPDGTATLGQPDGSGIPFEDYVGSDGLVDWTNKKHVCIFIDNAAHGGSHKQLWVLASQCDPNSAQFPHSSDEVSSGNGRGAQEPLHNAAPLPRTCGQDSCSADTPNYDLYDDQKSDEVDPGASRRCHDTIPLPPGQEVFVVMSFDASQQIGRFVFHCHILKHEDKGLMAPIEVWGPLTGSAAQ